MSRNRPLPSGRWQARRPGGQFRRDTVANLGVRTAVCEGGDGRWCGQVNAWGIGEEPPTRCRRCGAPLNPSAESEADRMGVPTVGPGGAQRTAPSRDSRAVRRAEATQGQSSMPGTGRGRF